MAQGANENETLYMLRQKDEQTLATVMEVMRPVFVNLWQHVHQPYDGFNQQEACQLAAIGLFKGLRAYREDMPMSFRNFMVLCAFREMRAAWRRSYHQDCLGPQVNLSLDYTAVDGDQCFSDYVTDPLRDGDPARQVAGRLLKDEIDRRLVDGDPFDRQVLQRRLEGYTYKEIASQLDRRPKDVDNALQRIRHKIDGLFD